VRLAIIAWKNSDRWKAVFRDSAGIVINDGILCDFISDDKFVVALDEKLLNGTLTFSVNDSLVSELQISNGVIL